MIVAESKPLTKTLPKPLPKPDPLTRPYWDALREGRLELPVCDACRHQIFYPRAHCPVCHTRDVTWREASGRGKVYALTVVHRPSNKAFAEEVPYVVAMITLDEGARMMANLDGVNLADPLSAIDSKAEICFSKVDDDITLPRFRMVDD